MRRLILAAVAICPAFAGTTVFRATINGGQSIYRGYDLWLQVAPRWFDAETASINMATHTITVPSRTYANAEAIYALSAGQLPSTFSQYYPAYEPCQSTGNTFRIVNSSVGSCTDTSMKVFSDVGTGQFYIGKIINSSIPYFKNVVLPPGVSLVGIYDTGGTEIALLGGRYRGSGNGGSFMRMHLLASPDAPVGTGTVSITVEAPGVEDIVLTWPVTVKDTPTTVMRRPTSFPPIPGKAYWESQLMARAAQWCNKATGVMTGIPNGVLLFGVEQQQWYYDGAWVYRQVAAYTGDPAWIRCADNITTQYREGYILPNKGNIPDWRIFSDGMKAACANCDGRNRHTLLLLASANLAGTGGQVWGSHMRETSYLLESTINAAKGFGYDEWEKIPNSAPWGTIKRAIKLSSTRLLGMMDAARGDHYVSQQTFMIGLGMRALIQYWEYTKDPRVPVEIKALLDYHWDYLWDRNRNQLIFNRSPKGAKCEVTCNPIAHTELINLNVPAFAWYWSITGDETYRERGDEIFSHALDTSINYSGKIFTQNYRWSFDYILLREGQARYRP